MSWRDTLYKYRLVALAGAVVFLYVTMFSLSLGHAHRANVNDEQFIVATGDSGGYVMLARTMLEHHRFSLSATDAPEVFRTPGYPAFIALVLWLTNSVVAVSLLQILCVALSAVLVFNIGERFFSWRIGLCSALLFAAEPTVVSTSFVALSDSVFVTLFLFACWCVLFSNNNPFRIFLAGIAFGGAALVRPLGLYFVPLFLLFMLWPYRNEFKKVLFAATIFLLGTALLVVPWMSRNNSIGNHFSLSSISTYNPVFYNVVGFESTRTGVSESVVREEIITELGATGGRELDTFQYADRAREVIRMHISAHPLQYLVYHVERMLPFFFGTGLTGSLLILHLEIPWTQIDTNISALLFHGNFQGVLSALASSPLMVLEMIFWVLISFCMAFAVVRAAVTGSNRRAVLLCVLMVAAFAVSASPVSTPRYRIPAEPFMFLLASNGLSLIYEWARRFFHKIRPMKPIQM